MFGVEKLTAKMLVANMLMVKLPRTRWNISKCGANLEREGNLQGKHTWKITPSEISEKEDNNHKRKGEKNRKARNKEMTQIKFPNLKKDEVCNWKGSLKF